jgi:hypothetical protein
MIIIIPMINIITIKFRNCFKIDNTKSFLLILLNPYSLNDSLDKIMIKIIGKDTCKDVKTIDSILFIAMFE